MTDRKLTEAVKEYAKQLGADLIGVAPVDRFEAAPAGHKPQDLLPEARSVVMIAKRMLTSTFLSPNPRVYVLRYLQLRSRFQDVGYDLCRFLEDQGYWSINFPSTAPQDVSWETKMLVGDFSYKHAAQLAGLGQIGLNQLLITPQFGPRVWLMGVITTAELAPDPPFTDTLCTGEECNICAGNCPEGALSPQGIDLKKCTRRPGEFGISNMLTHIRNILEEKDTEKRNKLIYGPTTWALWMRIHYGGPPSRCNACIATCPVGWKASRPPIASVVKPKAAE